MAESSELLQTQTCVEWRIKNFWNLSTKVDDFLTSPDFYFADTEWNLAIYPNGDDESEELIDLYLFGEPACMDFWFDVRIGMKNYDGTVLKASSEVHKFKIGERGLVLFKSIPRSALKASNAVSPDGTLTIFCSVALVEGSLVPSTKEVASQTSSPPPIAIEAASQTLFSDGTSTLIRDLKDLYINSHQADLTITVKDKEFRVHSNILSCRSSVFKSMLLHDMMEKYSGSVDIPDGDPDTFEDFLLFLYSGQFDNVTSRNAVSLYRYSDKYDVQELKDECVRRMIDELTDDIFYDVLQLAALQNEQGLLKAATDYFIKNAKTIAVSSQWLTFLEENTQLGNELFVKLLNSKDNIEK